MMRNRLVYERATEWDMESRADRKTQKYLDGVLDVESEMLVFNRKRD